MFQSRAGIVIFFIKGPSIKLTFFWFWLQDLGLIIYYKIWLCLKIRNAKQGWYILHISQMQKLQIRNGSMSFFISHTEVNDCLILCLCWYFKHSWLCSSVESVQVCLGLILLMMWECKDRYSGKHLHNKSSPIRSPASVLFFWD